MDFDVVLVGYRIDDTRAALRFCGRSLLSRRSRRRILVLNKAEMRRELAVDAAGWEILAGSNTTGEFSGWQEGLALLPDASTGVLFLNDTVATHRVFTRLRLRALLHAIDVVAERPALVGFQDRTAGALAIAGMTLAGWVSSYCFCLTAPAIDRLEKKVLDADEVSRCVPGGISEAGFFSFLSPDLETHLRHWLFGGLWYAGGRLTAANTERLQFKARCVVAELLLSARCEALGIALVDPFLRFPLLRRLDRVHRQLAPGPAIPREA